MTTMTTMTTGDPLAARIGEAHIDDRPISARLAKRLAEAAFGYMGLGPVYLVAAYEPMDNPGDPYDVACFRNDWAAAESHAAHLNTDHHHPRYGVFGPYATGLPPRPRPNSYSLETVSLLVQSPPHSPPAQGALPLGASEFDSLFWTRAAVEKFAVPYYAALWHMPWSEYTVFESSSLQGTTQQGPIPVVHYLDENGHWQRKLLHPGKV
jgi:hypothetical protein